MNKFITRVISFILCAACILTCVSCTDQNSKAKLSIYLMDSNRYMITEVDKLSNRSDAPEVEMKVFLDEDADKFASEVISGISSGEGPDIIVFSPSEYADLKGLIQEDLLCDLNELIKKDKSFKLSDYNEKVMDCGVIDGKRYFIPVSFYIPTVFTTKELLSENGMDLEGAAWDLTNLSEIAKKDPSSADYIFDSTFSFNDLLENCGLDLYNTKEKTSKFESQEFIELLDMYKSISKSICPVDEENVNNDLGRQSNLLKSKTSVLANMMSGNPNNLYIPYSTFQSEVDPAIYPMPSYKNNPHITAQPVQMIAISEKCKNKAAAFKYIKLLLSEEYQVGNSITFCPVNNSAYEKVKSDCLKNSIKTISGGVQSDASLKTLVDGLDGIIKRIEKCIVPDYSIESIVKGQLKDFLSGSKTAAETATLIQSKAQTYFKEGIAVTTASESLTENVEKKPPLKMYLVNYDNYLSKVVSKFNSSYNDINIETSLFSADGYKNKIVTELASGEGPDIIETDLYTFPSIHKVMSNGAFCDLNELISNDKGFDFSDYNEKILNVGIYKGKRYIIPISYFYDAFYTTQKVLDDNQIDLNFEKWDWESIAVVVKKFIKDNEGKQKYFFAWNFGFSFLLNSYGKSFVDFDKKNSTFSSEEFVRLLKVYKEICPTVCPYTEVTKYGEPSSMLLNGYTIIVNPTGWYNPYFLSIELNNIKDLRVYPYPVYNGKKQIYVKPAISLSINAQCKYKKEAWNYIKLALDSEKLDSYGINNYAPVNKKHFESLKSDLLKSNQDLCDLIDSAECSDLCESEIVYIIDKELPDFLNGKRTAEQTAKIIDDKVNLYLNE